MSYIFLFATGFIISRLSVRYGLVEQIFSTLFKDRSEQFIRFLFYLAVSAALVSMVIPNFITALTLLPILEHLQKDFTKQFDRRVARRLITAMALIVIYSCNIGGMGSLIGSPANGVMLLAMNVFEVAGRDKINFISWFGWSLPLVAVLIFLSWLLVSYLIVPAQHRFFKINFQKSPGLASSKKLQFRIWMATAAWLVGWSLHSIFELLFPVPGQDFAIFSFRFVVDLWDYAAAIFSVGFVVILFGPFFKDAHNNRQPLLRVSDCFKQLPWRAFAFVFIVLLIVLGISSLSMYFDLNLPKTMAKQALEKIPENLPAIVVYFSLLFLTTMLTEFFNNTTVAGILFPLAYSLAAVLNLNPFLTVMSIGLASTNAFMLPIATPVNALIYGGIKNISLKFMIVSGFFLNIISSIWMALFLSYIIPWYYGF